MSRKLTTSRSRELSLDELTALKEKALLVLADTRRQLIYRYPFAGSVSMNLELIPTRDCRLPTAACDGKHIYFDIDFLASLSADDRVFVLAHEIWHAILCHLIRNENRDRNLFNIACDMEVNQLLKTDGLIPPKSAILPNEAPYYFNKTDLNAEAYYELLLDQQKKQSQRQSSSQSSASKGGNGSGSASASGSSDDSDDAEPSNDQSGGNKDGKLEGQFDKHLSPSDDLNSLEKQDVDDKYGKVGEDPDFQPNVTQSSVEHVREAAISAAQTLERQRGELPAHIKKLVNELLEPEIPWQEVLAQFITRCMGDKTSWSRPARRFVSSGTYLPSRYGEMLKVAVGIDTSGSTDRDMPKFLGEVNALLKSFGNYELTLIECDASVGKYEKYDESNPLDLENKKYNVTGGGGTRLMPIFDKLSEENDEIDALVIFTDGYCEKFAASQAPLYPVLWVLTKDGTDSNFGFGEVVKFH